MKTTSLMRRTSTCDIRLVRMEQISQPFFPETPLHDTSVHTSYSVQPRTSLSVRATYEQGAMYCGSPSVLSSEPIIADWLAHTTPVAFHTFLFGRKGGGHRGDASKSMLKALCLCGTKRWRYEAANMTSCVQYLVLDGELVPQARVCTSQMIVNTKAV